MLKNIGILVVYCALLSVVVSCGKKETVEATVVRPADIRVAIVTPSDIQDIYTLPGVAEAWEVISVPAETAGPIRLVAKEEGDLIKAGEEILQINTETLASNLKTAEVQLDARKKDFSRTSNLFRQQSVSQKAYDDAADALKLAEVSYKIAKDEYDKGFVKSPVTGIIDIIPLKRGEYVAPGSEVVKIVQMDKLKIYISVPEKDVPYLKVGQKVGVYPADISEAAKPVEGVINYISVTSDPQTLTYKARVDISSDSGIRPGRIVRTDIIRRDIKNAIVADMYTIVSKNGKNYVYVEHNGKALERVAELGAMIGKSVVVNSGLEEGDRVIVSGQQFLSNNTVVRIAE